MDAATVLRILEIWLKGGGTMQGDVRTDGVRALSSGSANTAEAQTLTELAGTIIELAVYSAQERPICPACREIVEARVVEEALDT